MLYLDARSSALSDSVPTAEGQAVNDIASGGRRLDFVYTFAEDAEIIGHPVVTLWVSQEGHDDMDLYFCMEKLNRKGKRVRHQVVDFGLPGARTWMPILADRGVKTFEPAFFPGATACIRVSRRALDEGRSTPERPVLAFDREEKLADGEVVRVDVPFWPIAERWHKGESLRLTVAAMIPTAPELPNLPEPVMQPGRRHFIHTGPEHPSALAVQIYPATR